MTSTHERETRGLRSAWDTVRGRGRGQDTGGSEVSQVLDSVRKQRVRSVLNSLSVVAGLVILVVIFSVASPYFLTAGNIYRIFEQVAVVAVLTVGQSFVVFTAGIDLSQGSVTGLSAVVGASVMVGTGSIALGVLAGLGIGAAAGVINALLITRLKLVPFIATLAMLGIASGASLLYSNGQPIFGIPDGFYSFGTTGIYVFPFIVLVAVAIAILFQFVSTQTRSGRYVYAIGSNESAARIAGVRTSRTLLGVYTLSGLLAGVAGMLLVAYVNSAQPSDHVNLELNAIAAAVIGGASLFGGEGAIWSSMIGALLISVLDNGTELLGISTYIQTMLLGVVVIIAVVIDNVRRRSRVAA